MIRTLHKHRYSFLVVGSVLVSIFILSSCTGDSEDLVEKAERDVIEQKPQLAKYLFLQVIQKRKEKDSIRFRALKGYAEVSLSLLPEYEEAARVLKILFEEYSAVARYREELRDLRLQASKLYRINLERPAEALDVLSPLLDQGELKSDLGRELGQAHLQMGNYEEATHWFTQSWAIALREKSCRDLKSLQLDLMQVYSLRDLCSETLKWSEVSFPEGCEADDEAVRMERANCFELSGDVNRAIAIYEEMIKQDPKNVRAHFFLNKLKKRQKEKAKK